MVIGFFDNDYDGFEENPNRPCPVAVGVRGYRVLEIPLQIRLIPRPRNASGKKSLVHFFNRFANECTHNKQCVLVCILERLLNGCFA